MLVEPIIDSGRGMAPSIQIKLPVENGMTRNDQQSQEAKKAFEEARSANLEALAADFENNLKIIHNVDLKFSVHKASGKVMVVVRDEQSGEVIREIPESEILNLAARLDEMIGLIFDKKG